MTTFIKALVLIGLLASCNNTTEQTENEHGGMHRTEAAAAQYTPEMVVNTTDFVCGMPTTAGIKDTCHLENKAYGFCSPECMAEFKKEPAKYLAKQ